MNITIPRLRTNISLWQQWSQWFNVREDNWVEMYLIQAGVEYSTYYGKRIELRFVLLGLGMYVEVCLSRSE